MFVTLLMSGKSCTFNDGTTLPYLQQKIFTYKPVYNLDLALKQISADTPHIVKKAGKIYAYKNYILQCEVGEDIHVIDNTNPSTASRVAFIKVLGANEISIKDNFLYTNSFKDLVVIDINNVLQQKETKRIANAFAVKGYLPAPPVKTSYECVDLTKGVVVGWVIDSVYANCYNC